MNGSPILLRIRRAFIAHPLRTTGDLVRWVWPRRTKFHRVCYDRVRRAAAELAGEATP